MTLKNILLGFGLFLGAFGAMAEAPAIKGNYSTEKVADSTWVIHGPTGFPNAENQGFMNNPGFVLTDDGVVVIDPGSSVQTGRMVLDLVAQVTDQPVVASFSTHIHGDHWLGNQAIRERFPDAVLYAHPNLIEEANAGAAGTWLDLMMQLTAGATEGTRAVIPDTPVGDGDVVQVGGLDFSIHHKGKAHTATDISVFVEQQNVLFTGDLVFNRRLGRMDDGSFTGLSETLAALIDLSPKVVVPGHGPTEDVVIIESMKKLHDRVYEIVEERFEEGMPDFEIKPIVLRDIGKEFSDWQGLEDGIGRLVSLCYLEVEENNF